MLKTRLLIAIASAAFITLAGGIYLNAKNDANVLSNSSHTTVVASVWYQSRESYSGNKKMTVYRSPSCNCCGGWIEHMKKQGFQITDIKTDKIETIKQQNNIPSNLASCHTATIDGYVIEGHVPADDVKRFLKQKPQMAGLSVPAMPIGTPGMESGDRKQPFDVLAFNTNGKMAVFKHYEKY